jgi:preprotein translocase subunit SecG
MLKKSYIIHNGKQLEVNADFLIGKKQVKNDFDITTIVITFLIFATLILLYNFINPNHLIF